MSGWYDVAEIFSGCICTAGEDVTEVHVPAPGLLSACSSSQGGTLVSLLLLGCTCGTTDTQHCHGYTAGSLKMVRGKSPAAVQPCKCSFRREESIVFPVRTHVLFSLGPKQFRHQARVGYSWAAEHVKGGRWGRFSPSLGVRPSTSVVSYSLGWAGPLE